MRKTLSAVLAVLLMFGCFNFSVYAEGNVYISDIVTICKAEYSATYSLDGKDFSCYIIKDNLTEFKFILNPQDKVAFFNNEALVTDEAVNAKLMTMRIADKFDIWYAPTIASVKQYNEIKKSAQFNKIIGTVGKLGGASLGTITGTVLTGGASEFADLAAKAGAELLKKYVTDVENILTEVKWAMLGYNIDRMNSTLESIQSKKAKGIKTYEEAKAIIDEAKSLETDTYATTRILMGALSNVPNDVWDYFSKSVFGGFTDGAVGSVMNALKYSDNIYNMMLDSDNFYKLCKFASDVNQLKKNVGKIDDFLKAADTFGEFSEYLNARELKKSINIFSAGVSGNKALSVVLKGQFDKVSETKIKGNYDFIQHFKNGMAIVCKGEKYGYIDTNGNEIVAPKYDAAYNFSSGLACVYSGNKFGFIDMSGNLAIPMKYTNEDPYFGSEPFEFVNDKCLVSQISGEYENLYGVIDKQGNEIVPCKYNYLRLSKTGEIFYSGDDSTLKSLTNPGNSISGEEFYNMEKTVTYPYWECDADNNWSLYDANNNCIAKNKYNFDILTYSEFSVDSLYFKYSDGVSIAVSGAYLDNMSPGKNQYWIVDENGNEIAQLPYDDARTFSNGLSSVIYNGKYGYVDKTGYEVIPLVYEYAQPFDNGVAIAKKDGKYIILKVTGESGKPNNIQVVLNNSVLTFEQPPVTENDRTLVPMRKIFESLNASVAWDEKTQTVRASSGNAVIEIQIDSNKMKVNGKEIGLDTPARLIGDRTFVPIRAVSEGLGAKVDWVDAVNTVTINQI